MVKELIFPDKLFEPIDWNEVTAAPYFGELEDDVGIGDVVDIAFTSKKQKFTAVITDMRYYNFDYVSRSFADKCGYSSRALFIEELREKKGDSDHIMLIGFEVKGITEIEE